MRLTQYPCHSQSAESARFRCIALKDLQEIFLSVRVRRVCMKPILFRALDCEQWPRLVFLCRIFRLPGDFPSGFLTWGDWLRILCWFLQMYVLFLHLPWPLKSRDEK